MRPQAQAGPRTAPPIPARAARARARHCAYAPELRLRARRADRAAGARLIALIDKAVKRRRRSVTSTTQRIQRLPPRESCPMSEAHRRRCALRAPSTASCCSTSRSGLTSNAALQQVSALFGARKAGHAGSLDPLASGLLPVCFGQATKVCGRLLDAGKTYRVHRRSWARAPTSGDGETRGRRARAVPRAGRPRRRRRAGGVSSASSEQVPPMHSALKHRGQAAVRAGAARRSRSSARRARSTSTHSSCVRAGDADDLAVRRLLLEGHLHPDAGRGHRRPRSARSATSSGLRRLSVEPFGDEPMVHARAAGGRLSATAAARDAVLLPPDRAVVDLAARRARRRGSARLLQGQTVAAAAAAEPGDACGSTTTAARFLGIVRGRARTARAPDRRQAVRGRGRGCLTAP